MWKSSKQVKKTSIFESSRGFELLTQKSYPEHDVLTLERYCKWYDIYVIPAGGKAAHTLTYQDKQEIIAALPGNKLWVDHALIPSAFVALAKALDARIDLNTYHAVCLRYFNDVVGINALFTSDHIAEQVEYFKTSSTTKWEIPTTDELLDVLVTEDMGLI